MTVSERAHPVSRVRARARVRAPSAMWAVVLIALANAIGWSLIIPPIHVPDETSHVFYAQYLGETGKLPRLTSSPWYSGDEIKARGSTSSIS